MATRKRRSASKARAGGGAEAIAVRADPRRKAMFDRLSATMAGAKREEMSGFDAYYEALGDVLDRELYVYGGYDTADAYLKAVVKLKPRTAWRYVRVARLASPAEEERYTPTLLDAVIAYVEAVTGGPVKERLPIKLDALRIPVEKEGGTERLPLDRVTLADVQRATKLVANKGKGRVRASPAEKAIADALSAVSSLAPVTVSVSQGELRLGRIPLAALGQLARVLSALDLPSPNVPPAAPRARPASKRGRAGKVRP